VNKGDVLCNRDDPAPISDLFEAELDILELLDFKPIISKGYQCIIHIHTVADEAIIKDIICSFEKNDKQEVNRKEKPHFVRSFTKILCRISTRIPIPIEKFDTIE
jgi:peptide chain release factor subunit 3